MDECVLIRELSLKVGEDRSSANFSKGVVVAVLGLAEFVEEEDDGLQPQDQHYPTDEACGIKGRVLVRGGCRADCCDSYS